MAKKIKEELGMDKGGKSTGGGVTNIGDVKETTEHRYDAARKIRKTKFGDLFADKLMAGGGIGESFSKTIGEKTKAKMTGVKEFFDPMNMAKKMTGGSNWSPALMGRITGRSAEDTKQFVKPVTPTATKVDKLESAPGGGDALGILQKILTLMQKTSEDSKTDAEKKHNFDEENKAEKDKKDKEMLAAIKAAKGGKTAEKIETQIRLEKERLEEVKERSERAARLEKLKIMDPAAYYAQQAENQLQAMHMRYYY